MQLEVKYDRIHSRVYVEDISTGIIGMMIKVNNDDHAYKVMSSIDLDKVAKKVKMIAATTKGVNK